MKFLHLGDLHLGKSLGDFDLIKDQEFILRQLLEIIDREAINGVLIAGDVYDKAIPSEAATRLLNFFLEELAAREVSTIIISGNHDSDDRLNFGSGLFKHSHIYISAKYTGELDRWVIDDGKGKVNVYALPFVKASQVKHYFPEAGIETYEAAVEAVLATADIDLQAINILVAHQFVAGKSEDPALGGSEGAGTQSVGLVEYLKNSIMLLWGISIPHKKSDVVQYDIPGHR